MKEERYSIIIHICMVICLPISLVQWYFYIAYRKNRNDFTQKRLEKSLIWGLGFIFIEILVICFLFFEYGRHVIHVMGTFW